jgi:hypothetical protein
MSIVTRAAVAAILAALVAVPVAAQGDDQPHPATLRAGLCDAPGDVVADLGVVSSGMMMGGVSMAGEVVGAQPSGSLQIGVADVPIPIEAIVAADHSIVVQRSADDAAIHACGNVGGVMLGEGRLAIALAAGEGGQDGVATLTDLGDGATRIATLLGEWDHEMHGGMSADGASTDVVLGDFHVDAAPVTIVTGSPFTFHVRNDGQITHELVLEPAGANDEPFEIDGAASELEDILSGTERDLVFTFTEPGMYQIACHIPGHYEAGMVHTFEVVAP